MSDGGMIETNKPILDACCGSRMFWRDKHNPNVLYVDNRVLRAEVIWKSTDGKDSRYCTVEPDIVADFTALPFASETFVHVVFDPPHLVNVGERSWMAKKYGRLDRCEWPKILRRGFDECWRVLKPNGTLIFKWGARDIPIRSVLDVIGREPLYGHITGKGHNTLWAAFVKLKGEEG